jgi:hypothetical protein
MAAMIYHPRPLASMLQLGRYNILAIPELDGLFSLQLH